VTTLVSDFLVGRLREWVRQLSGYTGIKAIVGALQRAEGVMFNNVAPETSASGGC
jgi:hypothetical protein